jgi:hypothetical protein
MCEKLEWNDEDESWFQEMQAIKEQEMEDEKEYRDQSRNLMITKEIAEKLNIGDEVHYGESSRQDVWLVLHKCLPNPSGEDFVLPIKQKLTDRIGAVWLRVYDDGEIYGNYDAFHV